MVGTRHTPLAFQTAAELGEWLAAHHQSATELWVRIFKSGASRPSVTWADCVVEAIRFGWIDGQKLPFDTESFLQRLTPRMPKSNWSAKNCAHATTLIAEDRMAPAGLAQVEAAKADGRWDKAYAGSATMTIPQDFLDALEARPKAKAFFLTLDRKNLYPIYYRLHTAKKPETRAKRMELMLAQLERGERFH
ncbi:YdeI/OmpD-associated family protein [Microvirga lotononidis]|nr:YdeI/OmpD-associated family protein [Microvirga lotononidis]WQO25891.1 YdeI/OmpD-associated family protein [Microvirga lotononidis]